MTDGTAIRDTRGPARTDPPLRAISPELLHSGITVHRFVGMYGMGAIFPVTAGVLLLGWRALGAIALVMASTAAAAWVWRRIGSRGAHLRPDHILWASVLLAMTLPADLFSGARAPADVALWPMLVAGGVLLGVFIWLLGGLGSGRVHPVLVTHLLLFVCFKELLVPHYVLQRRHVFLGDLYHSAEQRQAVNQPWIRATAMPQEDSIATQPASEVLLAYTTAAQSPDRAWTSLETLLRDRMPPLEDLIVGGHPAPIGSASAIAVIIGGLFVLYRGLIDYRVPLLIIVGAAVAMLVLPVPVVIKENDAIWSWAPIHLQDVGWQIGLTLVNYELMAGPLMFTAFFLATSPAVRPIARRARSVYAIMVGLLAGTFQLYVSVAIGAYLALLITSLLTPTLDKLFGPRTLV